VFLANIIIIFLIYCMFSRHCRD